MGASIRIHPYSIIVPFLGIWGAVSGIRVANTRNVRGLVRAGGCVRGDIELFGARPMTEGGIWGNLNKRVEARATSLRPVRFLQEDRQMRGVVGRRTGYRQNARDPGFH